MSVPQEHHVQFFTAVCKDWLPLLQDNTTKVIVINALKFRVRQGQVKVCGYVIMPNHLHVIWRISKGFKKEDIQRDLLKFTAREILQQVKVSIQAYIPNCRCKRPTDRTRCGSAIP